MKRRAPLRASRKSILPKGINFFLLLYLMAHPVPGKLLLIEIEFQAAVIISGIVGDGQILVAVGFHIRVYLHLVAPQIEGEVSALAKRLRQLLGQAQ